MRTVLASLVALAAITVASPSSSFTRDSRLPPKPQSLRPRDHPEPAKVASGTFEQLLDHDDPSKGTFEQRYWYNTEFYGGPGSPVFMLNAGEMDASQGLGYMSNDTLPGLYAQHFDGAVILFEHRYFGRSIPANELTAETLQHLTLSQSIRDQTYFAKNVKLHFDSPGPSEAPWVLIGGSYPGALAAWTSRLDPDTFAAYHASSAVVEAIGDFWTYYAAVESALPTGCAADIKRIIAHFDDILDNGSPDEIAALKKQFGVEALTHSGDVAALVAEPLTLWQVDEQAVYDFCDLLESGEDAAGPGPQNKTRSKVDGPGWHHDDERSAGVGLQTALPLYGGYVSKGYASSCSDGSCDTHSPKTEARFNRPHNLGADRAWMWLVCNEPFLWWQVGPPQSDGTNIISSQLRPEYYQRQCDLMFPETNGFKPAVGTGATVDDVNRRTGGWDADFDKVLFCNGQFDPWITATVSSEFRDGGARTSSEKTPIFVMEGGNHVPDFEGGGVPSSDYWDVVDGELEVMGRWLKDFNKPSNSTSS